MVLLLIVVYKVVLAFETVDEILKFTLQDFIQMKAAEQYFAVILFIILWRLVLTFGSADEILKFNHSDESCWAVLSCGTIYYAVQGGSNFWVCGWNPMVWPFKWKLLSSTLLRYSLFIMLYKVVLTFESVHEILKRNHSNANCWTVLSCNTFIINAVQGDSTFWVSV